MVALSCAATGAIIDAVVTAARGKATGELSQMRTLARSLKPGDVLVGDAIYDGVLVRVAANDSMPKAGVICCDPLQGLELEIAPDAVNPER